MGASGGCMGANEGCVGASRCSTRASRDNIVTSGGCFRVDGCRAARILSTFLSDRDFLTTKPGDPRQGLRGLQSTEGLN